MNQSTPRGTPLFYSMAWNWAQRATSLGAETPAIYRLMLLPSFSGLPATSETTQNTFIYQKSHSTLQRAQCCPPDRSSESLRPPRSASNTAGARLWSSRHKNMHSTARSKKGRVIATKNMGRGGGPGTRSNAKQHHPKTLRKEGCPPFSNLLPFQSRPSGVLARILASKHVKIM